MTNRMKAPPPLCERTLRRIRGRGVSDELPLVLHSGAWRSALRFLIPFTEREKLIAGLFEIRSLIYRAVNTYRGTKSQFKVLMSEIMQIISHQILF